MIVFENVLPLICKRYPTCYTPGCAGKVVRIFRNPPVFFDLNNPVRSPLNGFFQGNAYVIDGNSFVRHEYCHIIGAIFIINRIRSLAINRIPLPAALDICSADRIECIPLSGDRGLLNALVGVEAGDTQADSGYIGDHRIDLHRHRLYQGVGIIVFRTVLRDEYGLDLVIVRLNG